MGMMDAFGKEDRLEITVSQLTNVLTSVAERTVLLRGIVNRVPYEHIEMMMFGDSKPKETNKNKEETK